MAEPVLPFQRSFEHNGRTVNVYGDDVKSFYNEMDLFYLLRQYGIRRRYLRWLGAGQRVCRAFNTKGGARHNGFVITSDALPGLVRRCNNVPADVYDKLGLDRADFVAATPEPELKKKFVSAFRSEQIMTTLKIQGHVVDMYFPQYNVVVDFAGGKKEDQAQRRVEIIDELGCEYVVIDSTRRKFDVFEAIGDLLSTINRRRGGNYALSVFTQRQAATLDNANRGAKLDVQVVAV